MAARRLLFETLEDRVVLTTIIVTNPLDPATLTAGTLRSAVSQANSDAASGKSDTIMFSSSIAGDTIVLRQGPLELARERARQRSTAAARLPLAAATPA